jgi:hypothetical protein
MNARLYYPALGRFISLDPYVQMPDFTQSFNRYAYGYNNPLSFTDPSGENPLLIALIVGAAFGAYSGGVIANDGQYNPTKWDYSSSKTWGYMLGGAVVGGISGAFGASIATSGGFMANTMGIMGASFMNSVGMHMVTGGQTPVSIGFGVASYDLTNNEWGYLGKKGNSALENIGYGLGALANLSDAVSIADKFMGLEDKWRAEATRRQEYFRDKGHVEYAPSSTGRGLDGGNYMGAKNLLRKGTVDEAFYGPSELNWSDIPSYLHDTDYILGNNIPGSGASTLLLGSKAYGADLMLAFRQTYLSLKHASPSAFMWGTGMIGISAYKFPYSIWRIF